MFSSYFRLLLLSAALVSACFGQAFTANFTGLVTDPGGAVIPGAQVKLRNTATNEERQTTTGAEGRYTFSQLLPGNYELSASSQGFKTFVQREIQLLANQSAELTVQLQVGDVAESIEVSGAAIQLDTQTANQTVTITQNMVQNLPTNARNPMLMVHATAGVVSVRTGISDSTQDQNHDRFGMNGGRGTTTLVLLDGVSATANTGWNGLLYSPSVDSVQEVQINRNSYDAQFGRSGGGVVSIVTKGGSSQFHGSAFEFLRNSVLDANSWTNNRSGLKKPIFQRNQFGGNLSGPIWRDKRLFFFGGYEGLRQGTPSTTITTVASELERQGDFSQTFNANKSLATIYNPFTTRPNTSGPGSLRDPFPNNRIPVQLIDPVGAKAMALYPNANNPGDEFTGARNYVATGKAVAVSDRSDIRVDWARSEKHTMYARYSKAFRVDNLPPNIWVSSGDTGPISHNPRYHVTVGNTFVLSPTLVMNVLAGHGSWTEAQRSEFYGRDGAELGLPSSVVALSDAKTIPQFFPANYSNISYARDLNLISRVDNLQVNLTKEMGAHSIKFGFTWESAKRTGGAYWAPRFNFNRGMTSGPTATSNSTVSGNSLASMLLGTGSGGDLQKPVLNSSNNVYYGGYIQDTWRIGRKLTLSPGLRYELQRPPTDRYNHGTYFDPDVVHPLAEKVGLPLKGGLMFLDENNRFPWNDDRNNFAPRLGVAYKITDKLVLRTGYGIFYPLVRGGINSTGYSANTPWLTSVGGDGITPLNLLSNPFPSGLVPALGNSLGLMTNAGLGIGYTERNYPNGYVQNYSLDFQYELDRSTVVEVGYAGHQGRKLGYGVGLNDNQLPSDLLSMGDALNQQVPNPFFGYITSGNLSGRTVPRHRLLRLYPQFDSVSRSGETPGGSSSYNAFLAKITKQFSQGLTLLASYQWSKAIDNLAEGEPGLSDGFRDYSKVWIERAISAHDIPHNFVTTFVYDLPFGRGRRLASDLHPAANLVLGGWQVSGIVRFQSGLPFRVTAPSTIGTYGFGAQYPNLMSADALKVENQTPEQWFNTSAFSAAAPYTVGSAPRRLTELRQAGAKHADIALMKNFHPTEALKVQFRAEFFNLTNTPQFGPPDASFGSNTFGRVNGTFSAPARNVQFGLRMDF
ncbi:MAG: TonB-dependent receptor [Bryobacterales bacterium]|nr:TonB-dependent receptor [Bryobacterales bacterium]